VFVQYISTVRVVVLVTALGLAALFGAGRAFATGGEMGGEPPSHEQPGGNGHVYDGQSARAATRS
jgi:hypothetical protein